MQWFVYSALYQGFPGLVHWELYTMVDLAALRLTKSYIDGLLLSETDIEQTKGTMSQAQKTQ